MIRLDTRRSDASKRVSLSNTKALSSSTEETQNKRQPSSEAVDSSLQIQERETRVSSQAFSTCSFGVQFFISQ